jgi:hypothetical protein
MDEIMSVSHFLGHGSVIIVYAWVYLKDNRRTSIKKVLNVVKVEAVKESE